MKTESTATGTTEIITPHQASTLTALFAARVSRTPDKIGFRQYDRKRESWQNYTWNDVSKRVDRLRQGFRSQGLQPGDRVAILLPNSIEWVCADQAALAEGLVVVPLYLRDNPDNQAYIIQNSGATTLFIDSIARWQDLKKTGTALPELIHVLCLEEVDDQQETLLQHLDSWLPTENVIGAEIKVTSDDLATLVYTSGTTGRPKGVMLTHRNILWNCHAILQIIPASSEDVFLSFLPLSHAFERTVGYYIPIVAGASIAYSRSIQELSADMQIIRPTVLISVPRIYERVAERIEEKLSQKGPLSRKLFRTAIDLGYREFESVRDNQQISPLDHILGQILVKIVGKKILAAMGGRIRIAVTGGAALSEDISRQFIGLGLNLVQGYGLTEASPVISTNCPEENFPASVGRPLPDVEVRLDEMGELQVKSPGVMQGYWQQPELTQEAFTDDGWLKTGDVAELVNGFIYIRGRLKEFLITSTGENIAPVAMEMTLEKHPLINQALVLGEARPFPSALLVLNASVWQKVAQQLGLDPDDPQALLSETAKRYVLDLAKDLLHNFQSPSMIHGVHLSLEEWTIENGMLTPTLKLIRKRIKKRYAQEIEDIYVRR